MDADESRQGELTSAYLYRLIAGRGALAGAARMLAIGACAARSPTFSERCSA